MKIAIFSPSSVPFRVGGAENLWWGLLHSLNQYTQHQTDLIKVPSPESNLWELVDNYRNFSQLDLSHFDLVISGKYPSWMVDHPNHFCYMLHKLRGLYDTYPKDWPEIYHSSNPEISGLQEFMRCNQGSRAALNEFYQRIDELRSHQEYLPNDAFAFPGPLAREIVHFLDGIGLHPKAVKKYAAIAHQVANRKDYFPINSHVEVIYPPPIIDNLHSGRRDYLFTASRLEQGSKRVGLLIEAMKYVQSDIEFKIAGTGSDVPDLKKLANGDKRIIFVGHVNNDELTELYANAFAVLYIPYYEDYGLITVEAMMSGKPVITTVDSGGPNEFVKNGKTGYSVELDPKAIAERIDYLCNHRAHTQEMGLAAQKLVKEITWENTVNQLLAEPKKFNSGRGISKRKKITLSTTFTIFPPRGGGQSRVFHLYKCLAKKFDIQIVSLTNFNEQPFRQEIAPGLEEIRIPKSAQHHEAEVALERNVGIPITDVVMPKLYSLTPDYVEALKQSTQDADLLIACHPYCLPALRAVSDKPFWYEAQDIEVELKRSMLPNNETATELLQLIHQVEEECCRDSELIFTCSERDATELSKVYNISTGNIVCVPNGVSLEEVNYTSAEQRLLNKSKPELSLSENFIALFMGSWHQPNLDAVNSVFTMATHLPEVTFLILGSSGLAFDAKLAPENVSFLGVVDEHTKDIVLGLVDVALNPMESGTGTNLKMLDYFAAGVPVISTPFGARGLNVKHGKEVIMVELEKFPEAISSLKNEDKLTREVRINLARKHVEDHFDWQVIADKFVNKIDQIIN